MLKIRAGASALLLAAACSSPTDTSRNLAERFPAVAPRLEGGRSFKHADGGFEAEVRRVESLPGLLATFPLDAARPVELRFDGDVVVRAHELGARGARVLNHGALESATEGGTARWAVTSTGVEEWIETTTAGEGPIARWRVEGVTLEARDGAVMLLDELRRPRGRVSAPQAYTFAGKPARAWLAVAGTELRLFTDARGHALVDPLWTAVGTLGSARAQHTATLLPNGKVLVVGGAGPLASAELYDTATGTWSATGSMATARFGHTATLLRNGKVLVAGGEGLAGAHPTAAELYDPDTGTWSPTSGGLVQARMNHTATLLNNGKVLVAGGGTDAATQTATAELFDPALGTFASTGNLPQACWNHAAALLQNGKVLVAGGAAAGTSLAAAALYDVASGTFTATGALNMARASFTATVLMDGRVLAFGGAGVPAAQGAEVYAPAGGTWGLAFSITTPRASHSATMLPSGKVLLAGGLDGVTPLATTQIFDGAGTLSNGPPLVSARSQHTATLVPSGQVVLAGGAGAPTASEVYDEQWAGTWTAVASMTTARYWHTLALLPSGQALAAGGYDTGSLSSAEFFTPTSGLWTATGAMTSVRQVAFASTLATGQLGVLLGTPLAGPRNVERYDPQTTTWSAGGTMPRIHSDGAAALLPSGQVLVCGGTSLFDADTHAFCDRYDPRSDTWAIETPLLTARRSHAMKALADGRILVVGGLGPPPTTGSARLASTEVFDPQSRLWADAGTMPAPKVGGVLVPLASGGALDIGGDSTANYSPTVFLWDPMSNSWSETTPVPVGIDNPSAVTLPSGRVLVYGGIVPATGGADSTATYLFNPVTRAWVAGAPTLEGRNQPSGVLLSSGKVLISGGYAVGLGTRSSAEQFDEGRGALAGWTPTLLSSPAQVSQGGVFTAGGLLFTGQTEGASGSTASCAANVPVVQLQAFETGILFGTVGRTFSANAATVKVPSSVPQGYYLVRVVVGGVPSNARVIHVLTPPVIVPGAPSSPPRGTIAFSASGGFGPPFTWVLATNGSGGAIDLSTGVYTAGPTPLVTDAVQVTDVSGGSSTVNVSVTQGVALIANGGETSTPPLGPVTFTAWGGLSTNPDGGPPYLYSMAAAPSGGHVDPHTGAYWAGDAGLRTDVIQATDTLGNSGTFSMPVTAGISVTPSNPTVVPRGGLSFHADGGSGLGFRWSLATNASGGTIGLVTGVYAAGATGGVTDAVRVADTLGNEGWVNVAVSTGVAISPNTLTLAPLNSQTFTASGGSGAGYQWSLDAGSGGAINSTSGAYTAGPRGNVIDLVGVGDSLGNTAALAVTVGPGIFIAPPAVTLPPLGRQTFTSTGVATSGVGFSATGIDGGTAHGTVNSITGEYLASDAGLVGDLVHVTDGFGNDAVATVSVSAGITVTPAAPTVAPRDTITLTPAGGSNSAFAWAFVSNTSGGSMVSSTNTYTAGPTPSTIDVLRVSDSLGNAALVSVTVGAGLSAVPASATVAPGAGLTFTATGGHPGSYSWALSTNRSGATIGASSGAYVAGRTGGVSDDVQVSDGIGNTATATITVGPGLFITPVSPTVAPQGSLALTCGGGSGAGFQWAFVTNASGGLLPDAGATVSYAAGAVGSSTDVVQCMDSLSNITTRNITVSASLAIGPPNASVAPGGAQVFTASGGSLAGYGWSVVTAPAPFGTIDGAGRYVAGSVEGVDTVRLTDSNGNVATAQVTVTARLSITPGTAAPAPRESVLFTASGGSDAGYAFQLVQNQSGATLDAGVVGSAWYVAGADGGTFDRVRVTDSNANQATATVSVRPGVSVTPQAPSVSPAGTVDFVATGGIGAPFTWSMASAPSGGAVDSAGHYVAGHNGFQSDVVRATDALGNLGETSVSVGAGVVVTPTGVTVAPHDTVTFSAAGGSGAGYTFAMRAAPSGGAVNPGTGKYVAGAVGLVTDVVEATDPLGNVGQVNVDVSAGVVVSPSTSTLPPRGSVTFTAIGGKGLPFSWALRTTTTGQGAAINPATGVYTAGERGGATDVVIATDALNNVGEARVTTGAALSISPAQPFVAPTESLQFLGSGGSGAGFVWDLPVDHSGAIVAATTGLYTAGRVKGVVDAVGLTDSLGNRATVFVNVQSPLVVTPVNPSVSAGDQVQFTAAGGSETGYHWALTTASSGGAIDADAGQYTAGAVGDVTDVVEVTDSKNTKATSTVSVQPAVAADGGPAAWTQRPPVAGWPLPASCHCGAAGSATPLAALLLLGFFARRRRARAAVVAFLLLGAVGALAAPQKGSQKKVGKAAVKKEKTKSKDKSGPTTPSADTPHVESAPPAPTPPAPLPPTPPRTPPKPSVAILDVDVTVQGENLDKGALSELLTASFDGTGRFRVTGSKDVATVLGFERQKQLLGCGEESSSCMGEIAAALGADYLALATVGRVGPNYLVSCRVIDSATSRVVGRASVQAASQKRLAEALWRASQQSLDAWGASLPPAQAAEWATRPRQQPPIALADEPDASSAVGLGFALTGVFGYQPLTVQGLRGSVGGEAVATFRPWRLELQAGVIIAPSPGARVTAGLAILQNDLRLVVALRGAAYPGLGLYGGGLAVWGEYALSRNFGLVASVGADVFPVRDGPVVSILGGAGVAAHL
jgi:hypothetical protein